jgi:hypothetical protein
MKGGIEQGGEIGGEVERTTQFLAFKGTAGGVMTWALKLVGRVKPHRTLSLGGQGLKLERLNAPFTSLSTRTQPRPPITLPYSTGDVDGQQNHGALLLAVSRDYCVYV